MCPSAANLNPYPHHHRHSSSTDRLFLPEVEVELFQEGDRGSFRLLSHISRKTHSYNKFIRLELIDLQLVREDLGWDLLSLALVAVEGL